MYNLVHLVFWLHSAAGTDWIHQQLALEQVIPFF